ncbi:MAG: WxL domain-containing protein [Thermomicrobiales bacterium]
MHTLISSRIRRIACLATVLIVGQMILGLPALAADTVIQQLSGGNRTATITDANMSGLTYSHEAQTNDHNLTLTVSDASGTGEGWNVTVQASNFIYSGIYNGSDINASEFEITTANSPQYNSGQAIDGSNGPKVPAANATGSLDVARKVLQANAGYGQGSYSQTLAVRLTVPPMARVGTYTSSLTVTIGAGP